MSDSNEIFELQWQPPPQLVDHLEYNPLDQLRWSPNGIDFLNFGEGGPVQSSHPIALTNFTPSMSSDQWLDDVLLHDNAMYTDNPPQDQLLNTTGIGPSQSTEGRILELRPGPHLEEESGSDQPEQLRRMEVEVSDIGEPLWSQPRNPWASHQSSPHATGEAIRTIDINIEEEPVSEVIAALWKLLQIVGSIPNHQDDTVGEKQKEQRVTSSLVRRKRSKIHIPYETLLLHRDKTLKQAADAIRISETKLKFAVQEYKFAGWADFKFRSKNDLSGKATHLSLTTSLHVNHSAASTSSQPDEMLMQHPQIYGGTNSQLRSQPRNQAVTIPPRENNRWRVTVMAAYRKKTMVFDLFPESKKEDLEKEVMKRVNLQLGSFYLDYKNEAGLWIYIGCDEDLKRCMDSFRSSDRSTVEMVVQLND